MFSFFKYSYFKPNSKAFIITDCQTFKLRNIPEVNVLKIFKNNAHTALKQNEHNTSLRHILNGSKKIIDGNSTTPKDAIYKKRKSMGTLNNFDMKKIAQREANFSPDIVNHGRGCRSSKMFKVGIAGPILQNGPSKMGDSLFVRPPSRARSLHTEQNGTEVALPHSVGCELHEGLRADSAYIAPKYLYDPLGSKLFETICMLPEYYPTRTEAAIVDRHAKDIATSVGSGVTLIDLGAGNCAKAARLIPLLEPRQYVPVDISAEFLEQAARGLSYTFPALDVQAVAADFSSALRLPSSVRQDRRLFFYPGSSIGNFSPDESARFLSGLRGQMVDGGGGLLLGVDLVKDASVLEAAYDDALGVSAAFNRNVLLHVNRLLGADFDIADWRHMDSYNSAAQRVEIYLEAKRDVVVTWSSVGGVHNGTRSFRAGERIHTANSHKYKPDDVRELLHRTGLTVTNTWFDSSQLFMICYAEPNH